MNRLIGVLLLTLFGCGNNTHNANSSSTIETPSALLSNNFGKQLNISILLDLSDRISPKIHPAQPEHYERDIAIIKNLINYFKADMSKRGAYLSKGKIKIFFSPSPEDPEINNLAKKLDVDLSVVNNKLKKNIYDHIINDFEVATDKIYKLAIRQGSLDRFKGSDIWRFFKNDVRDYCINKDTNYRNILIIMTDGYIYHPDSKDKFGNRTTYLTSSLLQQEGLRGNPNWLVKFNQGDYGFLVSRKDLVDLEVLVLEVNPSENYKNDEDIIKKYISKWFDEMNIKHYSIFNSDLPNNTKKRIDDFLSPK